MERRKKIGLNFLLQSGKKKKSHLSPFVDKGKRKIAEPQKRGKEGYSRKEERKHSHSSTTFEKKVEIHLWVDAGKHILPSTIILNRKRGKEISLLPYLTEKGGRTLHLKDGIQGGDDSSGVLNSDIREIANIRSFQGKGEGKKAKEVIKTR